jgi:hypothetical protein
MRDERERERYHDRSLFLSLHLPNGHTLSRRCVFSWSRRCYLLPATAQPQSHSRSSIHCRLPSCPHHHTYISLCHRYRTSTTRSTKTRLTYTHLTTRVTREAVGQGGAGWDALCFSSFFSAAAACRCHALCFCFCVCDYGYIFNLRADNPPMCSAVPFQPQPPG